MNTKPVAITVLCFGDSNTYGTEIIRKTRFDAVSRWTGVLQEELGDAFYVIEEGLGGRTVNADDTLRADRNGLKYFVPCLQSHDPDVVVVMLGTNDTKVQFEKSSASDIATDLQLYKQAVDTYVPNAKFVLVAPGVIDPTKPNFADIKSYYDESSVKLSTQLPQEIEGVAKKLGVTFVDSNLYIEQGSDGIHWTKASHQSFGKALAKVVK